MKPLLQLCLVLLLPFAIHAAEARSSWQDAVALVVAESALVTKFGGEAVDAQRPFRLRSVVPGRMWVIEGTLPAHRTVYEGALSATVHHKDGEWKVAAFRKLSDKKPNQAPEPTPCAVMPRATESKMKSSNRNAFPNEARDMPAQGVAHL